MFGASHFQKEWSENIDFWVSYSKNNVSDYKFDWLDYNKWLQIDWTTGWWDRLPSWDLQLILFDPKGYRSPQAWLQIGHKLTTDYMLIDRTTNDEYKLMG